MDDVEDGDGVKAVEYVAQVEDVEDTLLEVSPSLLDAAVEWVSRFSGVFRIAKSSTFHVERRIRNVSKTTSTTRLTCLPCSLSFPACSAFPSLSYS